MRRLSVLTGVSLAGCVLASAAAGVDARAAEGLRADFDVREAAGAGAPAAVAGAALARRLGDQGFVDVEGGVGGVSYLGRTDGFLTGPSGDDPAQVALGYVRGHRDVFGLDGDDLDRLRLTDRYTSLDGVTHLVFKQRAHGIESHDTFLGANVTADGRLVNFTGAPVGDLQLDGVEPVLGARDALAAARADVRGPLLLPRDSRQAAGADRLTTFSGGDESAGLVAFATADGARLAWRVVVVGEDSIVYEVVVDGASGRRLARRSLTSFANAASIWDLHPDQNATPRTLNLGADPSWIDRSEGGTKLQGNNAHATVFVSFTGDEPEVAQVGGDWSFPATFFNHAGCPTFGCTWDTTDGQTAFDTRLTNREQTTTQAFYYVNHFHDHLLAPPIGFDEASRNFEFVNSSGQGLGGDAIDVDTLRSFQNGQYVHGADGTVPQIRIGRWQTPYDVRGSDSALLVYHEYTHGLVHRLVGAGTGSVSGVRGKALSEGWADWYALDLVVGEGLIADGPVPGEVQFDAYLRGNVLRSEPTDCTVGASAAICPGAGTAGSGGYTFGDFGKVNDAFPSEEHFNGEIWAQTLWDLRTRVGVQTARCLVTGGLRLSPASPGFLDSRDSILQSALVVGVPQATVWEVFAARGMGVNATETAVPPDEDFTVPSDLPPPPPPTGSCGTAEPPPGGGGPEPPPSGTPGDGSTTAGPTIAQIASALGADLKPIARALKKLRIGKLLKRHGFTAKGLHALTAGRFTLELTGSAPSGHGARASGKKATIAKGSRTASGAGRYSLKTKLTSKGKRLLRRAHRVNATLTLRFTPPSGPTQKRSATVKLRR